MTDRQTRRVQLGQALRRLRDLLSEPHRQNPGAEELHYVTLDALFAQGKDENDFDWVERMPVYRLDRGVLDRCHAFLKPKRKPRSVHDLYTELVLDGYCLFTAEELLGVVRGDERFVVEEEDLRSPGIRARRKRDGAPRPGSQITGAGRC